jgi:hypothetical protein
MVVLTAGMLALWAGDDIPWLLEHMPEPVARLVTATDKTGLDPFRLASIMSLVWLTKRLMPIGSTWLRGRLAAPWVIIGQNSLPVFCSGIIIGILGHLALDKDNGWLMQVAVNLLGGTSMVAVAALASWHQSHGRTAPPGQPFPPAIETRPGNAAISEIRSALLITAGPVTP